MLPKHTCNYQWYPNAATSQLTTLFCILRPKRLTEKMTTKNNVSPYNQMQNVSKFLHACRCNSQVHNVAACLTLNTIDKTRLNALAVKLHKICITMNYRTHPYHISFEWWYTTSQKKVNTYMHMLMISNSRISN